LSDPQKAEVFVGRWSPHRAAADYFHSLLSDTSKHGLLGSAIAASCGNWRVPRSAGSGVGVF
jgi:hypothetical protein